MTPSRTYPHLWPRAKARLRVMAPQAHRSASVRGLPPSAPYLALGLPRYDATARMVSAGRGLAQWGQVGLGIAVRPQIIPDAAIEPNWAAPTAPLTGAINMALAVGASPFVTTAWIRFRELLAAVQAIVRVSVHRSLLRLPPSPEGLSTASRAVLVRAGLGGVNCSPHLVRHIPWHIGKQTSIGPIPIGRGLNHPVTACNSVLAGQEIAEMALNVIPAWKVSQSEVLAVRDHFEVFGLWRAVHEPIMPQTTWFRQEQFSTILEAA